MACKIKDLVEELERVATTPAVENRPDIKGSINTFKDSMRLVGESTQKESYADTRAALKNGPTAKTTQQESTNLVRPEFDKLPTKESVGKTMTYAGVGSRQTPPEVLELMTKAATWLDGKGYHLQTGKAFYNKEEGADKAFSDGTTNKTLFAPEQASDKTIEIAKEMHPAPQNLKQGGLKLMARNTYQVFGKDLDKPVDFVLYYADESNNPNRPKGGTGQAVEMAILKGVPTINMKDKDWRGQLTKILKQEVAPLPIEEAKQDSVNVYAGSNENAELSNLAVRTFKMKGKQFQSVEHAYQSLKSGSGIDYNVYNKNWSKGGLVARGKSTKTDNNWNVDTLMKKLLSESFKQNPKAAEALLATGNKQITHTQDKGVWKTEFPRLLTEVREDLRKNPIKAQSKTKAIEIKEAPLVDKQIAMRILKQDKYWFEHYEVLKESGIVDRIESGEVTSDNVELEIRSVLAETQTPTVGGVEPEVNGTESAATTDTSELTTAQQEAYDKLQVVMDSKTDHEFLLEGPGGTGKSYTMGKVLADAVQKYGDDVSVVGMAVAHTAKDTLVDFIRDALPKDKAEDVSGKVTVQAKGLLNKIGEEFKQTKDQKVLFVIDEVSMTGSGLIDSIRQEVNKMNKADKNGNTIKLFMLGDRAQLRPITTDMQLYGNRVYLDGETIAGTTDNGEFTALTQNGKDMLLSVYGTDTLPIQEKYFGGRTVSMVVVPQDSKTRSKVFTEFNAEPAKNHLLTENKRNTTPNLKIIEGFREEALETVYTEENKPEYKHKYTNAMTELKKSTQADPGNMYFGAGQNGLINQNMISSILDGKSSILAPTNAVVNKINESVTAIVGADKNQSTNVKNYGVFEGQKMLARANISDGMVNVTNNTTVTLDKIYADPRAKALINKYRGDELADAALAVFANSIAPNSTVTMQLQFKVKDITDPATKTRVAVGTYRVPGQDGVMEEFNYPIVSAELLNSLQKSKEYTMEDFLQDSITIGVSINTPGAQPEQKVVSYSELVSRGKVDPVNRSYVDALFGVIVPSYAMTIHKSQGATFEHSVLVDTITPNIGTNYGTTYVGALEQVYVAMSRSKNNLGIIESVPGARGVGRVTEIVSNSAKAYLNSLKCN